MVVQLYEKDNGMTTSTPTGIESINLTNKQNKLLASHTQFIGYVPAKGGDPKKEKEIQKKIDKLHDLLEEVFSHQNLDHKLNMISLEELRKDVIEPNHNPDFGIKLRLLGPGVDSFTLPMNHLFSNGVQVVPSLTNCNESQTHYSPCYPREYRDFNFKGPRAQLASPLAAYYRWEVLKKKPDACDFLVDFKKEENTITHDGKELRFENIFCEENGYVYPKTRFEEPAERFLRKYANKIKINFEKVTTHLPDNQGRVEYFQALTAAFSLASYYTHKDVEDVSKCQGAAQLFLKTQFEIVARATVHEARKHPERQMPLVLCPVGYGFLENHLNTVASALDDAIKIIVESGCDNLHVYLSCSSLEEMKDFERYFKLESLNKDKLAISQVTEVQSHGNNHASGLVQRSRVGGELDRSSRLSSPVEQAYSSSFCCRLFNRWRPTPKNNMKGNTERTPLIPPKC